MTKYLTTYEELKANLGKKIEYTDTTCGEAKYEGFIKFDLRGNIYCNHILLTKKDTKEILPKILSIELIEEDNQHIVDGSTAGCCFAVNEGEMIQPADNINHPSHYQLEINNRLVDVNTILEAISKKLDGKCDLMIWNYFSNACEYLLRSFFKNQQLSDLQKAKKEIEFIINKLEK